MKLPEILAFGEHRSTCAVGQWHQHDGPELVWVVRGACTITVQGRAEAMQASSGNLFILPARIPHRQVSLGTVRTWYVAFDQPTMGWDFSPRILNVRGEETLKKWMSWICLRKKETHLGWTESRSCLVMAVLRRVAYVEERIETTRHIPPSLGIALRHLQDHFTNEITLSDLASRAGVSVSLLKQLFRSELGISPIQHRNDLRLSHAKALLSNCYLTVGEVAEQCGFSDPNYFVRLFHQRLGTSPGMWRKKPGTFRRGDRENEKAIVPRKDAKAAKGMVL
ncbi:MAG: AraC family transcriptional regulator [Terrimicrobiaceae bacterium]